MERTLRRSKGELSKLHSILALTHTRNKEREERKGGGIGKDGCSNTCRNISEKLKNSIVLW